MPYRPTTEVTIYGWSTRDLGMAGVNLNRLFVMKRGGVYCRR